MSPLTTEHFQEISEQCGLCFTHARRTDGILHRKIFIPSLGAENFKSHAVITRSIRSATTNSAFVPHNFLYVPNNSYQLQPL